MEQPPKKNPVWEKIKTLREKNSSKISRPYLEVNTQMTIEGATYSIKKIEGSSDPKLEQALKCLKENFSPEQLISDEDFKRNIDGVDKNGNTKSKFNFFYVEEITHNKDTGEEETKIIGVRVSEQLPIFDEKGNKTNENMFYGVYIAVDKDYRKYGLGTELYISALIDTTQDSQTNLTYISAECSDDTEKLQNTLGLRRVYFKENGKLKEYEYIQPCLDFDPKTGLKSEGAKESKEHFMICRFDDKEVTKEDVKKNILSLYKEYRSSKNREYFETSEAFEEYEKYFNTLEQGVKDELDSKSDENLVLMTKEERELEIGRGTPIINYDTEKKCKHNNSPFLCIECATEEGKSVGLAKKVEELEQRSGTKEGQVTISHVYGPFSVDFSLKTEGKEEKISLRKIEPEDKASMEQLFSKLCEVFDRDRVDREDAFMKSLEGRRGIEPYYKAFVLKNGSGEIIGVRVMGQFPIRDKNLNPKDKETSLYDTYIWLDERYRGGTGLAREIYTMSLKDAFYSSRKMGFDTRIVMGEFSEDIEGLQNMAGLKRVYFKSGNNYKEFEYKQPSLDFDLETGNPISQKEPKKPFIEPGEHFMLHDFNDKKIDKDKIKECLQTLYYQYRIPWTLNSFNGNESAYENCMNYFKNLENKIFTEIDSMGEIKLLSKQEREDLERVGGISVKTYKPKR